MRASRHTLRFRAAGFLGTTATRALFSTVRFRIEGREHLERYRTAGRPVIFVVWHDQLLPLVYVHRDQEIVALVSEHADGEYLSQAMERYGFRTARGSSTRGGARGLRSLVRMGREGRDLAVTPDGPRGPRHRFKEGALLAAQLTGFPLLPLAAAASAGWRFESWDRFLLPRPFSTVRVTYGAGRLVPRDAGPQDRARIAREMENVLDGLTARAAASLNGEPGHAP